MTMFCGGICKPRQSRKRRVKGPNTSPTYSFVNRNECILLTACWNQDWDTLRRRCRTHPDEVFHRTTDTRRTALHLVSMPGAGAPADVVALLLDCNPHALLLPDTHRYCATPLHFLCGSVHRDNVELMRRAVTASIAVSEQYPGDRPTPHAWSPLYMACSKGAAAGTIEALLKGVTTWIAPLHGCEMEDLGYGRKWSPLRVVWGKIQEDLRSLDDGSMHTLRRMTKLVLADVSILFSETVVPARNKAVASWLKLLVLIRFGMAQGKCLTMLEILILIQHPIPELVRFVCELFPGEANANTRTGQTILIALLCRNCSDQASSDFVSQMLKLIIEISPEQMGRRDLKSGLYPFAVAAMRGLSLECIYTLLQQYPQAMALQS